MKTLSLCCLFLFSVLNVNAQLDHRYTGTLHYVEGGLHIANGVASLAGGVVLMVVVGNQGGQANLSLLLGPVASSVGYFFVAGTFIGKGNVWKRTSHRFPYKGTLHKTLGVIDMTLGAAIVAISIGTGFPEFVPIGSLYIGLGALFFHRGIAWKKYSIESASNGIGLKYTF